jgi:shikimate dehydrogenase
MRKFGLIGYPLGHSFSKKYFTEKFLGEHIDDCSYENYPVESVGLLPGLILSDPLLCGLNVTIPYKSEVLRYLDEIEPEASAIGAVNVIKIRRKGDICRLCGFNSDITGISDSLQSVLRPDVRDAIILGTGGSSKAVRYVLEKMGISCILVSRSHGQEYLTYNDIGPELLRKTHLIVNTTPLGMYPDINSCPALNYDLLDRNHILFDLVYNPEITLFLKKGQERGSTTINGLKMLISQAEKSWAIWNDESI